MKSRITRIPISIDRVMWREADQAKKNEKGPAMLTKPLRAQRHLKNENAANLPRVVQQSLRTKQQIIGELIAGRLPLLQAAAQFQAAHSVSMLCLAHATGAPVAAADNENICRTVIGWVFVTLSNRPDEAERVSARLERELQGHLDRCGTLNLSPNH
jgi:hypothetical protein